MKVILRKPHSAKEKELMTLISYSIDLSRSYSKNFSANYQDLEGIERDFKGAINGFGSGRLLVAEVAGGIVGYASYSIDSEMAVTDIDEICMDKHFRGLGIATKMLERVIEESEEQRVSKVFVTGTEKSREFWENKGFQGVESFHDLYMFLDLGKPGKAWPESKFPMVLN